MLSSTGDVRDPLTVSLYKTLLAHALAPLFLSRFFAACAAHIGYQPNVIFLCCAALYHSPAGFALSWSTFPFVLFTLLTRAPSSSARVVTTQIFPPWVWEVNHAVTQGEILHQDQANEGVTEACGAF